MGRQSLNAGLVKLIFKLAANWCGDERVHWHQAQNWGLAFEILMKWSIGGENKSEITLSSLLFIKDIIGFLQDGLS